MDYWKECISEAFDESGIKATDEQIKNVVEWVSGAHDNYGMAHGHDCIPNPIQLENKQLRQDLALERRKVVCPECKGEGRIISHGPYHSSDSRCSNCRGSGKVVV